VTVPPLPEYPVSFHGPSTTAHSGLVAYVDCLAFCADRKLQTACAPLVVVS